MGDTVFVVVLVASSDIDGKSAIYYR